MAYIGFLSFTLLTRGKYKRNHCMNRQILVGKFLGSLCLAGCLVGCVGTGEKEPRSRMSLEGNWAVRLDSTDIGEHEA